MRKIPYYRPGIKIAAWLFIAVGVFIFFVGNFAVIYTNVEGTT